jgi:hypothetical protein
MRPARGHAMQGDLISEIYADALAWRRRIRRHTGPLDLGGAHVTPENQIESLVQIPSFSLLQMSALSHSLTIMLKKLQKAVRRLG